MHRLNLFFTAFFLLGLAVASFAETKVRFVHALAGAGPVNVLLNGNETLFSNVDYQTVTPYQSTETKDDHVLIKLANNNSTLYNGTLTLKDDMEYTLFLSGFLSGTANETSVALNTIEDNNEAPQAADSARVRFFNGAYQSPALKVDADGDQVIGSKVAYNSASDYVVLGEGTYMINVQDSDLQQPYLSVPVSVEGGKVYTFIAVGLLAANTTFPFGLVIADDATHQYVQVRATHASPSTPEIDVILEAKGNTTVTLATKLAYQKFGEYKLLPLQQYTNAVVKSGDTTLGTFALEAFTAGEASTLAIVGIHNNTETPLDAVVFVDNNSAPKEPTTGNLKIVHVAAGLSAVNVTISGNPSVANLGYKKESDYVVLTGGVTYNVEITSESDKHILATQVLVERGSVQSLYIEGVSGTNGTTAIAGVQSVEATFTYFTFRVVHAAPDAPTVDILRSFGKSNEPIFTGVSFGQTTAYATLPVMESTIIVTSGGDDVIFSSDHVFKGNDVNSFVLLQKGNLSAAILNDVNSAPTSATEARVRFMNVSPNSPAFSLKLNGEDLFEGIAFSTASDYKSIAAGSSNLTITGSNNTVLVSKQFNVVGGSVYTIYAEGVIGSTLDAVVTEDAVYNYTTIRASHAVVGEAAVDILVQNGMNDPTVLFTNIAYGHTTDYKLIVQTDLTMIVTKAGDHDGVLLTQKLNVDPNAVYTILGVGLATGENKIVEILDNNAAPTTSMESRVRFIHASPGAPSFTVRANDAITFKSVAYGTASAYHSLSASSYRIDVYLASNDSQNPVVSLKDFPVEGGKVYTLIAEGVVGKDINVVVLEDAAYKYFQVRAGNAAAKVGSVDILFNDKIAFEDVDFGNTTQFVSFHGEGKTTVEVVPHGETKPLLTKDITFEIGKDSTFLLVGLNVENSSHPIDSVVLVDSWTVPTSDNKCSIRFIALSPGAAGIDVSLNETALFNGVAYPTATDYKEVESGPYELALKVANTTLKHPVFLVGGAVYSVFAEGIIGGDPAFQVRLTQDYFPPPNFNLRVFQASPDTEAVDALVNGAAEFRDVAFEGGSDYKSFKEGTYDIKFVPAGELNPIIYEAKDVKFAQRTTNSMFLIGLQKTNDTDRKLDVFTIQDDNSLPEVKKVKVRFVHTSPDAVAVDLKADDTVLFSNVTYLHATDYKVIEAKKYSLSLVGMEEAKELLSSQVDLETSDGAAVYTFVLEGLSQGKPELKIVSFLDAGQGPPHEGSSSGPGKKGTKGLVIGLIVGGCVLGVILLAAIGFVIYKRRQRTAGYETIPAASD